jgi:glycosyl transferase family 25
MWEIIDKIVYINLDHRTERRDKMEKLFTKANIPSEKVVRFPAIKRSKGEVGCLESHTAVLQMAKKEQWKNVLILEDDIEWTNLEEYSKLEELTKLPNWHVIMLMGWYFKYDFPRIFYANHTSAYLVNQTYYNTLLENRLESVRKIKNRIGLNFLTGKFNADVYWNKLMEKDNWYGLYPCMCRQIDGFSDIGNKKRETSKIVGIFDKKLHDKIYS